MATIQHRYLPYLPLLAQQEELQSIFDELRDIGGYNPLTNEFTPLDLKDLGDKVSDGTIGMIDSESLFTTIGAAVEAGIIDETNWPSQLFANWESFDYFYEELACYEDLFRLPDPCWQALIAIIAQNVVAEGYATGHQLAEHFLHEVNRLPGRWP